MRNIAEVRKFMNGYYLYFGLRLAFAVLLPSIILYHYGILNQYILVPFGTLMLGLTDVMGALQRRVGALLIGTASFFVCALLAGFSRNMLGLQLPVLILLAFTCSLIGLYGTRMINVGMNCIIISIFFMDKHFVANDIFQNALFMTYGCIIYLFVFFISYKLRPYKLIQQMLGEHIIEVAKYLDARSEFYRANPDEKLLMDKMIHGQVVIREQQESLREIILKSEVSPDKASHKNRGLLMMFVDTIDVFELIMTSQQDYKKLHHAFDQTHILSYFGNYIAILSDELQHIGFAVQTGRSVSAKRDLDVLFGKCRRVFYTLRKDKMKAENVEDFIMLRQILYTFQYLTERIKKLYSDAAFNRDAVQAFQSTAKDYASFVPEQNYDYRLFFNSFSLKSGMFRHALRVTVALLIGWVIGQIFSKYNIGHIYWCLMTIVIVVKPAYSQSRIKNIDRITGTLMGGIISLFIVYTLHNETAIFILVSLATFITCTFSKINYKFYTIGITMLVVLSYNFMAPNAVKEVLTERLLNSVVGVIIGYLVSLFVLPNWENEYVQNYLSDMLEASKNYFSGVANVFVGNVYDAVSIKLSRRKVLIALANLSDNFQRMLSDPKRQQQNLRLLFRLVSINHTLTSYMVSLAQYAKESGGKYSSDEFAKAIKQIEDNFQTAQNLLTDKSQLENLKLSLPNNDNLNTMLQDARLKLRTANDDEKERTVSIRKSVTDYRTINELFELINTSVCDEGKIVVQVG
ncbi:MAG TPA: FUSC family membrane protein [Arachidicoccus sp.]